MSRDSVLAFWAAWVRFSGGKGSRKGRGRGRVGVAGDAEDAAILVIGGQPIHGTDNDEAVLSAAA